MKYSMLLLGLSFVLITTGCSPVLSRQDYGPVEEEWKQYIQKSYPAWKPAPSIPQAYQDQENQKIPQPENLFVEEEKITITEEPILTESTDAEPVIVPATEVEQDIVIEQEAAPVTESAAPQPQMPVAVEAAKDGVEMYTVQKGDTLSAIAYKFYGKGNLWPRIADQNNITNPNLIKAGQVLKIPVGKK